LVLTDNIVVLVHWCLVAASCLAGENQPLFGQSSCLSCVPGSYNLAPTQPSCILWCRLLSQLNSFLLRLLFTLALRCVALGLLA
jgi:hypothetical protein